jgi:hypothetical protein
MRLTILVASLLSLALLVAWQPAQSGEVPPGRYFAKTLKGAKELEVYSLDPATADKDGFHGYKVLGKITIKDADKLKALVAAIQTGVEEAEKGKAADFEPRHGIRFVLNKTTVDLLVCSRTKVYYNDMKGTDFAISKSPQDAFDKVLKAAGVELAKPAAK